MAPLGYSRLLEKGIGCAYGPGPGRDGMMFWILQPDVEIAPSRGSHVGFTASDFDAVDAFHAAAMAAGARENGGPGLRPEYSGN